PSGMAASAAPIAGAIPRAASPSPISATTARPIPGTAGVSTSSATSSTRRFSDAMNSYDLAGKCAIVTCGAGGIGQAIAARLLQSGARVSLWDIVPATLGGAPVTVVARTVDITDEAAIADALAADRAAFGRIDALV